MPTNANTFNSRVTSEALEAKFRQVFPAQGGAELVQDLFASGVIQPVVDFSSVAEGSVLPEYLQTAWDFSTGRGNLSGVGSLQVITNPGFWRWRWFVNENTSTSSIQLYIDNGITSREIAEADQYGAAGTESSFYIEGIVFLKTGESLYMASDSGNAEQTINYRQVADLYGNLVNPLGFTFS